MIGVVRLLAGLAGRLGLAGLGVAGLTGHLRLAVDVDWRAEPLLLAVGQRNGGRDTASDGDDDKGSDYDPCPGRVRRVPEQP